MWVYIWAVLLVPSFAFFLYWILRWGHEDLDVITTNDKIGFYSMAALLAMGWPIVAVAVIVNVVNGYINGDL